MNDDRFASAMAALAIAFNRPLNAPLLEVFRKALDGVPIADLERAVSRAIAEETFWPPPARLRQLAGIAPAAAKSAIAWAAVRRAIREVGAYQSVTFDDPTVVKTIEAMGGWVSLCRSDAEELSSFKAPQFQKLYSALEYDRTPAPPLLPGLHASQLGRDVEPPKPVLVAVQPADQKLLEAG
jgi:hypothetical protein